MSFTAVAESLFVGRRLDCIDRTQEIFARHDQFTDCFIFSITVLSHNADFKGLSDLEMAASSLRKLKPPVTDDAQYSMPASFVFLTLKAAYWESDDIIRVHSYLFVTFNFAESPRRRSVINSVPFRGKPVLGQANSTRTSSMSTNHDMRHALEA
jgi:hypothetical protein